MPQLIACPVDRADVTPFYEALADALAGTGPALAPYAAQDQAPQLPPQDVIDAEAPDDLALVVSTSGSTGTPKRAMLTRQALLASAHGTVERLGGPGTWLLPLPPQHIAGAQVLVRSIVAGTTPIVMEEWSVKQFAKATLLVARNAPPGSPIYTSIVPTQLRDILYDKDATDAARTYRAILVGGAATNKALREDALAAGLNIVTTYGSSETAGGCVYNGKALEGVSISILDPDESGAGRVAISGPTLASGYLDAPAFTGSAFETLDTGLPAYITDDLGTFDGTLTVLGRMDSAINTGGYKVAPHVVEDVARHVDGVEEAIAVALPDTRLVEAVGLALILKPHTTQIDAAHRVQAACREVLPGHAVPRHFSFFDVWPQLGIGKPDRAAIVTSGEWHNLS